IVFVVPIVAIVMVFGTGMMGIYFKYRQRKELFALYHQERMAAIEKGVELPPLPEDFFQDRFGRAFRGSSPDGWPLRRRSPHRTLLGGLIWLFSGAALFVSLQLMNIRLNDSSDGTSVPLSPVALIPAGIGLACLIYYFTVGR